MSSEVNQGTIEAMLEIAGRRRNTLLKLIEIVLASDLESAKPYARELRGDAAKPPQLKLVENECAPKRRRRG